MKTTILIIAMTIFSFFASKAQEGKTYLPVFGENSTRYYVGWHVIDGNTCCEFFYFDCIKDETQDRFYEYYNSIVEVSEDNSKMWIHIPNSWGTEIYLIMDLNMDIGDTFVDACHNVHTVSKVYIKEGRKHIEFGESFPVNLSALCYGNEMMVREMPLTFIEGVGPNITISLCISKESFGRLWLLSQHKDGSLCYGVPEWYPCWDYVGDGSSNINNLKTSNIQIISNPGDEMVKLILSDQLQGNNSKLKVSDTTGKMMEILEIMSNPYTFNTSQYAPGIYFLEVMNDNYRGIGKLIKK